MMQGFLSFHLFPKIKKRNCNNERFDSCWWVRRHKHISPYLFFLLKTSIFNKVLKSLRQEIINFSLKYTLYFIYNYLLKQDISMVTTPNSKEEYISYIHSLWVNVYNKSIFMKKRWHWNCYRSTICLISKYM